MDINIEFMRELHKTSHIVLDTITKNLFELGFTFSEFLILLHLEKTEKEAVQKLGDIALITSGTITFVINKLIKKGLVKKLQNPDDKRIFWISITDLGRKKFEDLFKSHMEYLETVLSSLSTQEKSEFIEKIRWLNSRLNITANEV
ncbi:MAG: MarR family transcriptional regulator [Eubacteriales bacterium]